MFNEVQLKNIQNLFNKGLFHKSKQKYNDAIVCLQGGTQQDIIGDVYDFMLFLNKFMYEIESGVYNGWGAGSLLNIF